MWYNEFNSVFFLSMATIISGLLALCIKYGFASKCDDIALCCGLIRIHRRVELEGDDEENNDSNEVAIENDKKI